MIYWHPLHVLQPSSNQQYESACASTAEGNSFRVPAIQKAGHAWGVRATIAPGMDIGYGRHGGGACRDGVCACVGLSSLWYGSTRLLTVAYFGDSFTWGQGNRTDDKFSRLFARDLEARTGIPFAISDYSYSGALLSLFRDGQSPLSTGP